MKVTPKMQQGGSFGAFFSVYNPTSTSASLRASSSSSKKSKDDDDNEKGKLTEKDLFNMLKDIDGLPNEMYAIVNNLMNTFRLNNLKGANPTDLATTYLSSLYQIKTAAQNKEKYDAALKNAETNGALGEPAITMDGKLIVQTKDGNLSYVSVELYSKSPDSYKTVNVSLLANMRAYLASLYNDLEIFNIMNNSVGYETFLKLLKEGISNLGSTQQSQSNINGLDPLKSLQILQQLLNASDEDKKKLLLGMIEGTSFTKDQKELIGYMTDYLVAVLPDRLKTWAAYKLKNGDKKEAARILVNQYLITGENKEYKIDLDYNLYLSRVSSVLKADKEADDKIHINAPLKFIAGFGDKTVQPIQLGDKSIYYCKTNTMPLTDKTGNVIGTNKSLNQAISGQYLPNLDLSNVSVAGKRVDQSMFNYALVSDGKVSSIDFPSTTTSDNSIVPNISPELIEAKKKSDEELKLQGIDTSDIQLIASNYLKVNEVYLKNGLNPLYDSNGAPHGWTRFAVMNGVIDERAIGEGFNRGLLLRITNEDLIKQYSQYLTEDNKDYSYEGNDWWGKKFLYKGLIWIPLKEDYVSATAGESKSATEMMDLDARSQAILRLSTFVKGRNDF